MSHSLTLARGGASGLDEDALAAGAASPVFSPASDFEVRRGARRGRSWRDRHKRAARGAGRNGSAGKNRHRIGRKMFG